MKQEWLVSHFCGGMVAEHCRLSVVEVSGRDALVLCNVPCLLLPLLSLSPLSPDVLVFAKSLLSFFATSNIFWKHNPPRSSTFCQVPFWISECWF